MTTEELSDKLDEIIEETSADRGTILEEAQKMVNGSRADKYGQPEDCFGLIAEFWSAYLGCSNLTPKDVSLMMVLLKLARESHQGKRDNLVDAAGYLGLAGDM